MSYARFGWNGSDVYVIEHVDGGFQCYCFPIDDDSTMLDSRFETRQEMIDHLLTHRANGDNVPQTALDRLQEEIEK